ncbi:hypothetical protein PM082_014928 [Marasmius tenuissimus]|nr:hypothetical protein PM082_014928 [Marasmius tenuissimus]
MASGNATTDAKSVSVNMMMADRSGSLSVTVVLTKDHFCAGHTRLEDVCAVAECTAEARPGYQTCGLQAHILLEQRYRDRGQAAFKLKELLSKSRMPHPNSSDLIPLPDDEEDELVVDDEGTAVPESKAMKDRPLTKVKAMFGRWRTHNEQLLVFPCGIIAAQETFFHSESLPSVVHFFKNTFAGGYCPNHLIFDNNCGLAKHVKGTDPAFNNVGLAVDVFHFQCKHSEQDVYCQKYCNPASFHELMTEDGKGWWFNTSVCEQTNNWFGGFQSICREMEGHFYDFFLDEMVMMRNELNLKSLSGSEPTYWV